MEEKKEVNITMIMENKVVYQGPGVLSLLLVAFIVMKLCGVITWPWLWVLSPFWIPLVIAVVALIVIGLVVFIKFK